MLYLIGPENFDAAAGYLWQMHKQRYKVFVQQMGWIELDSWLHTEIDQFDDDKSRYILAIDKGQVLGGLRVRSTVFPNLGSDIFAEHFIDGPPKDPNIWEYERAYVADPDWRSEDGLHVRALLNIGLFQHCLENGCRELSVQVDIRMMPALLAKGFTVRPIGRAFDHSGGQSIPIMIDTSPEAILKIRKATNIWVDPLVKDMEGLDASRSGFRADYLYEVSSALRDPSVAPDFAKALDDHFSGEGGDIRPHLEKAVQIIESQNFMPRMAH